MGIIRECGGKMHMSEGNAIDRSLETLVLTMYRKLEGSTKRLFRVLPELRRSRLITTHSGP